MLKEAEFENAIKSVNYSDVFYACELSLGVQKQGWGKLYDIMLGKIKTILVKELKIVYLNDQTDIVEAYIIKDLSDNSSNHNQVMLVVNVLRLLYSRKTEYHVTLIGTDVIEGIPILDNIKTIKKENLHLNWLTRVNNWFMNINEYKQLHDTWKNVYDDINHQRNQIVELSDFLIKAINDYFKKIKINKFKNSDYLEKEKKVTHNKKIIKPPKCVKNKYGLHHGISSFFEVYSNQTESGEQLEDKNDDKRLSSIDSFNKYSGDFCNFLSQKNTLLQDKMNNRAVSDTGRLSLVNLMFALEKLPKMESLFNLEFSKFINKNENSDQDEIEILFLLGIMWEYVYEVPLRTENSVSYTKKKELKQKIKGIDNFIQELIPSIQGVQKIFYNDSKELYVLLDMNHTDVFLEKIYKKINNMFENFDYGTFNYALLSLYLNKIYVQISYEESPTILGFEIRNLDFTKKDFDSFINGVTNSSIVFDKCFWEPQTNKIYYIIETFSLINVLEIIYKHVEDVINHMNSNERNDCIQLQTVDDWKEECDLLTKETFQEIDNRCDLLKNYVINDGNKKVLNEFIEYNDNLKCIDDLIVNKVSNGDNENETIMEKFRNDFAIISDLLL